ncbi:hypothetical protein HK105_202570 [Polyrhizophydium stewartii]|uniref:Ankyrin repeat protein n=1 Tax=Polyrhizophydium stewartii TaxID=2732419 RepID=A0ABR4NDZ2_9FUNG|nr:hypothetical protein HK105_003533 [Polyrhizophydium stewartii]
MPANTSSLSAVLTRLAALETALHDRTPNHTKSAELEREAKLAARVETLEVANFKLEAFAAQLAASNARLAGQVARLAADVSALSQQLGATPARRPSATNEWDRMPAEIQNKILAAAGPFTGFTAGFLLTADLCGLPKQQQLQVWQDAIDVDWQGNLDMLPPLHKRITSLNVHKRSFFSRIKDSQYPMDLAIVCIRNDWADLLDFGVPDALARAAAAEDAVWLLDDLINLKKLVQPSLTLVKEAASRGRLNAVRFLANRLPARSWTSDIGSQAAESGNLDLVVWLRKHHNESLDEMAFHYAAWRNHTHIVRWLANNTRLGCSSTTITGAVKNNNLEMVELLVKRFPRIFDQRETDLALNASEIGMIEWLDKRGLVDTGELVFHLLSMGKTDMAEWAVSRFKIHPEEADLIGAFENGQSNALKWAYNRGVPFTAESAMWAARYSNTVALSWAIERDRSMIPTLVESTAKHGHPALIGWWSARHGVTFGQRELDLAIRGFNEKVVEALLAIDGFYWDFEAALDTADGAIAAAREEAKEEGSCEYDWHDAAEDARRQLAPVIHQIRKASNRRRAKM